MTEDQHDVTIIGGGPAGSATALHLARRGCSVAVLERSNYDGIRIGETVPPHINAQLQSLGLWRIFLDGAHLPAFGVRSAWATNELHDNPYIFNPYGTGWHIDRCRFDEMITRGAAAAGAAVHQGIHVLTCSKIAKTNWLIEFWDKGKLKRLKSRFLVDATGRSSKLRQNLGAGDCWYDKLIGVATFYVPGGSEQLQDFCTLIESAEHGWWYSTGLPSNQLIVVHMTDLDLYLKQRKNEDEIWTRYLSEAQHTYYRVRHLRRVRRTRVFQAGSHRVNSLPGCDWLPVGDAAASMDPLCGTGIVTALQTAAFAAEHITAFLEGKSNHTAQYLEEITNRFDRYLKERRQFYAQEIRWTDSLFWQRRQENREWL
jgi:flavin-dependent dehydrogenase